MITAVPIIWQTEKGSERKNTPAMIETTVATPTNEDVPFTPIFEIALLARKKATIEHPIP